MVMCGLMDYGQVSAPTWGIPGIVLANTRDLKCSKSFLSFIWRLSSNDRLEGWGENENKKMWMGMSSNRKLGTSTFSGGLMSRRKDKPYRMEEESDRHQISYPQHWMLDASGVVPSEIWRNRTEDLEFHTKEENKSSVSAGRSLLWEGILAFLLLWTEGDWLCGLDFSGSCFTGFWLGSSRESVEGMQKPGRIPPAPVPLVQSDLCCVFSVALGSPGIC